MFQLLWNLVRDTKEYRNNNDIMSVWRRIKGAYIVLVEAPKRKIYTRDCLANNHNIRICFYLFRLLAKCVRLQFSQLFYLDSSSWWPMAKIIHGVQNWILERKLQKLKVDCRALYDIMSPKLGVQWNWTPVQTFKQWKVYYHALSHWKHHQNKLFRQLLFYFHQIKLTKRPMKCKNLFDILTNWHNKNVFSLSKIVVSLYEDIKFIC